MILTVKNIIFTVLVPGTVAVYVPYQIIRRQHDSMALSWEPSELLSGMIIFAGSLIYFRCLWDFAVTGRGTPAPIDAPKYLVVKGLYRYVRNPMYIGVLLTIMGWASLYRSYAVLLYVILLWLLFNGFVMIIEEPILRRQFGRSYEEYCKRVRRWIPGGPYRG